MFTWYSLHLVPKSYGIYLSAFTSAVSCFVSVREMSAFCMGAGCTGRSFTVGRGEVVFALQAALVVIQRWEKNSMNTGADNPYGGCVLLCLSCYEDFLSWFFPPMLPMAHVYWGGSDLICSYVHLDSLRLETEKTCFRHLSKWPEPLRDWATCGSYGLQWILGTCSLQIRPLLFRSLKWSWLSRIRYFSGKMLTLVCCAGAGLASVILYSSSVLEEIPKYWYCTAI